MQFSVILTSIALLALWWPHSFPRASLPRAISPPSSAADTPVLEMAQAYK